jgi:hypothetical protein
MPVESVEKKFPVVPIMRARADGATLGERLEGRQACPNAAPEMHGDPAA